MKRFLNDVVERVSSHSVHDKVESVVLFVRVANGFSRLSDTVG